MGADVSVVDLTAVLAKETSYEEICDAVKAAAAGDMKGFIGYCDEPLVSTDFESEPISSVFDAGRASCSTPSSSSASRGTTTSGATRTASSTSCSTWPTSTPRCRPKRFLGSLIPFRDVRGRAHGRRAPRPAFLGAAF